MEELPMLTDEIKSLPIALITGYLGAGKTTLLNNILKNPQGHKVAVIVNDIGEVNIDAELIAKSGVVHAEDNSLVPLQNGCICCTLKTDLVDQIVELARMNQFDYILIEASGVCEPMPIAQTITSMQETTQQRGLPEICHLDNIISVVDAARLSDEFGCGDDFVENRAKYEENEDIQSLLIQQMEFANVIILNKSELVNDEQKQKIKAVILALNPNVKIIEASYGKVDIEELMDTYNFDFEQTYFNEGWVQAIHSHNHEHEHEHHHEHEHEHHHHHHHDHSQPEVLEYGIDTFVYQSRRPFLADKLDAACSTWPKNIIRAKGFLWISRDPQYVYVFEQAGRQFSATPESMWVAACEPAIQEREFKRDPSLLELWDETYGDRENKIVFIGQNLDKEAITQMMDDCLGTDF